MALAGIGDKLEIEGKVFKGPEPFRRLLVNREHVQGSVDQFSGNTGLSDRIPGDRITE